MRNDRSLALTAPQRRKPDRGKVMGLSSTINGDAKVPFCKELGDQGSKATDIPVVAFSVGAMPALAGA